MWTKLLCIEYILRRILTTKCMFDFVIVLKRCTIKYVPINNHDFLNIQACSFSVFLNTPSTQFLVVSCKYWVVPLIPTRVSGGDCQGILCAATCSRVSSIQKYHTSPWVPGLSIQVENSFCAELASCCDWCVISYNPFWRNGSQSC